MKPKSMEDKIERIYAIQEIHNLMGKYQFLLSSGIAEDIVDLFAQNTPDVSACVGDWGIYRGIEKIRSMFIEMLKGVPDYGRVGSMVEHDLTTPVIEVAGDGKTARGVWMSPGFETNRHFKTGQVIAAWTWSKYACDFIKEGEEWKIWHFFNFLTFSSDYNKSWVEGGDIPKEIKDSIAEIQPSAFKSDGPSPYGHFPYDPNTIRQLLPTFPQPYETYDAHNDWINPHIK